MQNPRRAGLYFIFPIKIQYFNFTQISLDRKTNKHVMLVFVGVMHIWGFSPRSKMWHKLALSYLLTLIWSSCGTMLVLLKRLQLAKPASEIHFPGAWNTKGLRAHTIQLSLSSIGLWFFKFWSHFKRCCWTCFRIFLESKARGKGRMQNQFLAIITKQFGFRC